MPAPIAPSNDPGAARSLVWGLPWRGNVEFPGLAYCCGGKSLYWGGWCLRLTEADLELWPAATAAYLRDNYTFVESETGVVPAADFITGELHQALLDRVRGVASGMPGIDTTVGSSVEIAPLAVQGSPPESGLFGFGKFSSVPLLADAIRDDVERSGLDDARRRLFLVPRAHVVRLGVEDGAVRSVEVDVAGRRHNLPVQPGCMVVLAASAVESTRLALHSAPSPLMGRNLMAHVRSDFTVRVRRFALPPLPAHVQTGALLVRGAVPPGASTCRSRRRPAGVGPTSCCSARSPTSTCSISSGPTPTRTGSASRSAPSATWVAMDRAAVALAQLIAGSSEAIEYLYDGRWTSTPFPLDRPFPEWHRGLGTTYHEAGTLWMGDDPATSVTDPTGGFHHLTNLWACDQSVFPTVGSANPALTGMTLAKLVAEQHP